MMRLEDSRVAVKVERTGDMRKRIYKILPEIFLVKPGALMIPLKEISENAKIINEKGEELHASGTFYLSAETIDPYHILIDWF